MQAISKAMTWSDVFRPAAGISAFAYDAVLVIGGSFLIALAAQVSFYLPFSPVPVTGQSFAVLFLGMLLGSKRGTLPVILYLLEGSTGMPVFAGGAFGLARLMGPTGGYLMGFVPAAFLTGWLAGKGWDRTFATAALAMSAGTMVYFLFGLAWLSQFVDLKNVVPLGLFPYLAGDIVKIIIAAVLLPSGWKLLRMNQESRAL